MTSYSRDAVLISAAVAAGSLLAFRLLSSSSPSSSGGAPRSPAGGRIQLEYFNIKGVGEKVRLALALNGIEFDDVRLTRAEWRGKDGGAAGRKSTAKFGQLPILTLPDGREIYQSDAMLRYVGAMGNGSLYPAHDAERRLEIDCALGLLADLERSWRPNLVVGFSPSKYGHAAELDGDAKKAVLKAMRETWVAEELPKYMQYLADLIDAGGGPFLCGATLTIADLQAASQIGYYGRGVADFVPASSLDAFPKIQVYLASVQAEPRVAKYYASLEQ